MTDIRGWDRWAGTAVTLGLLLDWVPGYVGLDPGLFSLVKVVVMPVLVIDLVRTPGDYLVDPATRYGRWFLVALLVGVGGGVLVGTVPMGRLVGLLPAAAIFLFYLKARSAEEIGRLLKLSLWGAAVVPLVSLLGALGVVPSTVFVDTRSGIRVLTGVSWSTLGLYGVFVPAALGGLVFQSVRSAYPFKVLGPAAVLLAVGLGGVLVTGQRTALLSFVIAFVSGVVLYSRRAYIRGTLVVAALAALIVGIGWAFKGFVLQASGTVVSRVSTIATSSAASGADVRVRFYQQWADDLAAMQSIFPLGLKRFVNQTGDIPHFILGEAFYDGGLILMLTVLVLATVAGLRITGRWLEAPDSKAQFGMQLSLWFGFTLVLFLHPGLHTRLVYMMLGVWLAPVVDSARMSPAPASTAASSQ